MDPINFPFSVLRSTDAFGAGGVALRTLWGEGGRKIEAYKFGWLERLPAELLSLSS